MNYLSDVEEVYVFCFYCCLFLMMTLRNCCVLCFFLSYSLLLLPPRSCFRKYLNMLYSNYFLWCFLCGSFALKCVVAEMVAVHWHPTETSEQCLHQVFEIEAVPRPLGGCLKVALVTYNSPGFWGDEHLLVFKVWGVFGCSWYYLYLEARKQDTKVLP